ncbi:MAG TPA: phytanoyl-CoA dioxygenase family protein [Verrucomicrobiae bacterium]
MNLNTTVAVTTDGGDVKNRLAVSAKNDLAFQFASRLLAGTSFEYFQAAGWQILPDFISAPDCVAFNQALTPLFDAQLTSGKNRIGGVRNLLGTHDRVTAFAHHLQVLDILARATGRAIFPVRAIFFDKNPAANWLVPWHQDLAIPVKRQIDTPGFHGWSIKDGICHVHPPAEILAGMVTLRLHLDDCSAANGALRVISGSHLAGKIPSDQVSAWTEAHPAETCEVPQGGALLMRPLLLHASSPSEQPAHRRVLHIEYASQLLPNGLNWLN